MAMDLASATFRGYRRENGRAGVRNHVIVLPVDDLSNAACEAVANNIKGAMAIPHPYGRLQFGRDLDLHFRTLIGTGSNPNVAAVVVIGIEDGWTQRVVEGIAETGKPVTGYGIELHGDHETILRASKTAARVRAVGVGTRPRGGAARGPVGIHQVRGVGHDLGLRGQSHRRRRVRQALPHGTTLVFGETTEITGRRAPGRGAMPHPRDPRTVHVHVRPLPGGRGTAQDQRPVRVPAHQGQHRGRAHHHRGEGARQHPEDRPRVHDRRRARQGGDAGRFGAVVH